MVGLMVMIGLLLGRIIAFLKVKLRDLICGDSSNFLIKINIPSSFVDYKP
jgi:hypothetical protein